MKQRFDASGKVALVTGASGGIGRATATLLASAGASVMLVDLDESKLEPLVEEIRSSGVSSDRVASIAADVSNSNAVEAYIRQTVDRFGSLDILVNNAGIEGYAGWFEKCPEDAFDAVVAVNIKGVWLNMKHAINAMKAGGRGGAIVNLASGAAIVGAAGLAPYSASKHAVAGLTKTAAIELARHGIRVNAVCPGPIETRMMTSIERQLEAKRSDVSRDIPAGRYGKPEEVAAAIAYLACDEAAYVTGALLSIDGGSTAR